MAIRTKASKFGSLSWIPMFLYLFDSSFNFLGSNFVFRSLQHHHDFQIYFLVEMSTTDEYTIPCFHLWHHTFESREDSSDYFATPISWLLSRELSLLLLFCRFSRKQSIINDLDDSEPNRAIISFPRDTPICHLHTTNSKLRPSAQTNSHQIHSDIRSI